MANKYDKGHTTLRREYARGVRAGGGHLSHISKAERKKVMSIKPRDHGRYKKMAVKAVAPAAVKCEGLSVRWKEDPKGPSFTSYWYMNSCETNAAVDWAFTVGTLGGVVTALIWEVPIAGEVAAAITIYSLVGWSRMPQAQKNSDVNAIYLKDHTHWITVHSQ